MLELGASFIKRLWFWFLLRFCRAVVCSHLVAATARRTGWSRSVSKRGGAPSARNASRITLPGRGSRFEHVSIATVMAHRQLVPLPEFLRDTVGMLTSCSYRTSPGDQRPIQCRFL